MEMGERIGVLIKELGISKAQFAKTVGTSASRISNITTGRNKPDAPMLEKTMNAYPTVNSLWLLTGKGSPFQTVGQAEEAYPSASPAAPSGSPAEVQDQQDLTLLRQRADYLERENALLKGFLADLRRLMPQLSPAEEKVNGNQSA